MKEEIEDILMNSYDRFGFFDEVKATKDLLKLFSANKIEEDVNKPIICQDWLHQDFKRVNYKFCSICGTKL